MTPSRVFLSPEALAAMLANGSAKVDGDLLQIALARQPEKVRAFRLKTALHILREVGGMGDAAKLVGKVKDLDQVAALGGEYCANSLLIGESAYDVFEGLVGQPVTHPLTSPPAPSAAERDQDEIDLLASFLRGKSS